jgi:hypothetical protein
VVVLVVEQDEGGGGDGADAPGAQCDAPEGLEGGLEQGIPAFGERAGGGVQGLDGALIGGEFGAGAVFDRAGQPRVLAFVAQISEYGVVGVGPVVEGVEQPGVRAGAGDVVWTRGATATVTLAITAEARPYLTRSTV